jgi:hypothetical protein
MPRALRRLPIVGRRCGIIPLYLNHGALRVRHFPQRTLGTPAFVGGKCKPSVACTQNDCRTFEPVRTTGRLDRIYEGRPFRFAEDRACGDELRVILSVWSLALPSPGNAAAGPIPRLCDWNMRIFDAKVTRGGACPTRSKGCRRTLDTEAQFPEPSQWSARLRPQSRHAAC